MVGALGVLFLVAYPIAVTIGLEHTSTRALALGLAALVAVGLAFRLRGPQRAHALAVARVPGALVLVLLVASLFDDRRFVLALPAVTNALFLVQFVSSLRTVPIAERFARLEQRGEVTAAQIDYCRKLTIVWSLFFAVNGVACAALALFAPLAWWTLYTGLLSYLALGALVVVEYVVRKARFRTYGPALVDRALARVFPPRAASPVRVPK